MKVALVYDRVNTRYGGAEHVLTSLHQLYPDAPLFTSVFDTEKAVWAKKMKIVPSFLQQIPFLKKFHRSIVLLMPLAFETLQFQEFDLVISISSAEAKGILTSPDQLHICYLLTPTRYLWSHQLEYQHHWLTGWFRKIVFSYLKWWDTVAAQRPDFIVPISELVQKRTEKYYLRKTLPVIYPPVDLLDQKKGNEIDAIQSVTPFFLIVSRLVAYKRIDLAIEACQNLNMKLVIIGSGPDEKRLKNLTKNKMSIITFLSTVRPDQIATYYRHSAAFLAPGEEDFGISIIESLQAGRPAVVYYKSGAAELVKNGETGVYLEQQTVTALEKCITQVNSQVWDEKKIKLSVTGQSTVQFQSQFKKMVHEQWLLFEKGHHE